MRKPRGSWSYLAESASRATECSPCSSETIARPGGAYEHLDDFILGFADRLDRRVYSVPRRRRANPFVAGIRGDLAHTSLCDGSTDSLDRTAHGETRDSDDPARI
jgi:hypothetical protein